ncbi:hypothetical protein AB1Y20_008004 [Prymnesium parvum]|uniref:AB hydrolase-1 domain-containing protein n=1 Tax=Prymnesium parvum TaxID=97485 RepID=A0AB34ISH0_PRYPA
MRGNLLLVLAAALALPRARGFALTRPFAPVSAPARATPRLALPSYVGAAQLRLIGEPAALMAAERMEYALLELPHHLADAAVNVSFIRTQVPPRAAAPPLLLIHGFDISCLEFRRLLPLLEAEGVEAYALCVMGWGFTDTASAHTVGVEAKRAQLVAFWRQVLRGRPMDVTAASLGACVAADLAAHAPEAVSSLVMLNPALFTPAPPRVPAFAARLLIDKVIAAPAVRASIAKQAYFDKPRQTEDAIRVGMLHVQRPHWSRDSVEWLLLGGYNVSSSVPQLASIRCLTLWGRDDEVIPPGPIVPLLLDALPSAMFRWVEDCGHTPHLEQPEYTARAITAFVRGETVPGSEDVDELLARARRLKLLRTEATRLANAASETLQSQVAQLRDSLH